MLRMMIVANHSIQGWLAGGRAGTHSTASSQLIPDVALLMHVAGIDSLRLVQSL
jgi:hypothetical protein